MLTGYHGSTSLDLAPQYPSAGSVIARIKGPRDRACRRTSGLLTLHPVGIVPGYHGPAYLGGAYGPFAVDGDPNSDGYGVPALTPAAGLDAARLGDRRSLLHAFDASRRDAEVSGRVDGLDSFGKQAFAMLSGPEARAAFNITRESPRLRDRYGRHTWGQKRPGGEAAGRSGRPVRDAHLWRLGHAFEPGAIGPQPDPDGRFGSRDLD